MPVDKFGETSAAGAAPRFSTAGLVHKTGDTMLGILSMGGFRLANMGAPTASTDAATKGYVDTIDQDDLQLSGGTMTGDIDTGGRLVRGLPTTYPPLYHGDEAVSWSQVVGMANDITTNNRAVPAGPHYLTNKQYVDTQDNLRVLKAGDTMTGDLRFSIGSDNVRLLGCTDLTAGKGFSLVLGNFLNQLRFSVVSAGQTQTPVIMETTHGFIVQAAGEDVCQFGTGNRPIIKIQKNINMSNHFIKNLLDPADGQDAATKKYVDSVPILGYDGHIPPMSQNSSQTGFVVAASSFFNDQQQPFMAFAPQLRTLPGKNEWATLEQGAGAWIQIKCPTFVRIWKIRLRGRHSNSECITSWNLTGSTGDGVFATLLTSNARLGSIVQEFEVTIPASTAYTIYRLNVTTAEPTNTGLSHFQIFTQNIF